jgi:hypothetical protein
MSSNSGPVLREAAFEDMASVQYLKRAVGFGDDLLEDWDWMWRDNPAWRDAQQTPSMGWVLETADRIVGYLGSVSTLHQYREETVRAATSTGFAVDPEYRGYTLKLVAAFFKQTDKDILLNTTAIEVAGKIFQRFKASPMPQSNYDQIMYWVLRPGAFINAALKYQNRHPAVAWAASCILALPLRGFISLKKKSPRKISNKNGRTVELRLLDVSDIGQEFDDLWARKTTEETRLISYRTAEILRWHFAKVQAKVLCCYREGTLLGYAVVAQEDVDQIGLTRSKIADLVVEGDDPELVGQLLRGVYDYAKSSGSHVLEVIGFPSSISDTFRTANPHFRKMQSWPYFYLALDNGFHKELEDDKAWFACPFDGDTSLF